MKGYILFAAGLLAMGGCKKDDPAATSPVTVAVRVTATCPGIAPAYAIIATADRYRAGQFAARYFQLTLKQDQVDETRTVVVDPGPEFATDSLQATIALPGPYAGFTLPAGSFAQVDILVNGQVRKSARVDTKTAVTNRNPYLEQSTFLRFKDL